MVDQDFAPLDGNAAGGLLSELFAFEATVAVLTCAGCGTRAEVAAVRVYGGAMGAIFRCFHCDTAMLCVARTPRGFVVDLRGASRLSAPLF